MLPGTLKRIIVFSLAISIAVLASLAFRRLLVIGGKPETLGGSIRYPLKPAMRGLISVAILLGIAVWAGVEHLRERDFFLGPLYVVIGAVFLAALVAITLEISVDQFGIHYRMFPCAETIIEWDDLSHFERFYNGGAVTTLFFIRGKSGKTIGVGDTSIDTASLLREIHSRHLLREEPYKRRHWYGG
jgi:hypothetical protein